MYTDSHIHLSRRQFDGEVPCIDSAMEEERISYKSRDELIKTMRDRGIGFCIEPGVELESNEQLIQLSERYAGFLYPAVGVHPTRAPYTRWKDRSIIETLSKNERVVAIGELGLDYHHRRNQQHRIRQKIWFVWQLHLAHKLQLPLILHIRLADEDAVKILRRYQKKLHGGICHCFNRGISDAKRYTEEFGLLLGIGGAILQDGCTELEEAVRETPLQYLVLETDGPYVKPAKPDEISRKKWEKAGNTSLIIPDVAARVARIKGVPVSEVERVTTENVRRVFGLENTHRGDEKHVAAQ